jgi:anti-anti-sigma factor
MRRMSLEIVKEIRGSTYFLRIIGLMDYSTIDRFDVDIPGGVTAVHVDFGELDFIDSTGIGSVLSLIFAAKERNIPICFVGLNETVKDIFDTVGVFGIMEALQKGVS